MCRQRGGGARDGAADQIEPDHVGRTVGGDPGEETGGHDEETRGAEVEVGGWGGVEDGDGAGGDVVVGCGVGFFAEGGVRSGGEGGGGGEEGEEGGEGEGGEHFCGRCWLGDLGGGRCGPEEEE